MIRNALDENKFKESINRKCFCAKIELFFYIYIYICSLAIFVTQEKPNYNLLKHRKIQFNNRTKNGQCLAYKPTYNYIHHGTQSTKKQSQLQVLCNMNT